MCEHWSNIFYLKETSLKSSELQYRNKYSTGPPGGKNKQLLQCMVHKLEVVLAFIY